MTITTKLCISAMAATVFFVIFTGNVFFLISASQEQDVGMAMIIFGILCVGLSVWCLYASISLITSLRNLTHGAKIIADGNADYTFEIKSQDEIGQLAQLFNAIAFKLKQDHGVRERKVGEHVRDLESTNIGDDAMLANISDAVVATDEQGVIAIINNAALKSLGLERKNVIGRKITEVIFAQDDEGNPIPNDQRCTQKVLATGNSATTSVSTAYYYMRANKEKFPVAITATPVKFTFNGKAISVMEIFRDITKEKEIDRQKSEFISIASHQLRTPLGSMRWNLELMESEIPSSPKEAQERLREVHKINVRVINLVRDLLNVTRIDQGRVEDEPEPTDVADIIQSAIKEIEPQAHEKSISIEMKIKTPDTPVIVIDVKRFREVIQNLLTNAVRYTLSGGHVHVEIDHTDHSLEIAVLDTGIGIPEKEYSRIFSKFARAENAAVIDTEGSGLGLYIVKSYVAGWGGKIWFESKVGKGTTFHVSLPQTPQHADKKPL